MSVGPDPQQLDRSADALAAVHGEGRGHLGAVEECPTDPRLAAELARLRWLVDDGGLHDGTGLVGAEVEFQLVDERGLPAPRNAEILAALTGTAHDLQPELARFNLELNLPPVALTDHPLRAIRDGITSIQALVAATDPGTTALTIGTLPTLTSAHLGPTSISASDRYRALDARVTAARSGGIPVMIDASASGGERLEVTIDSIVLEAAGTSLQVHLDLPADGFPAAWNTAQAVAALQLGAGANAPLLLGRTLWHESRIPLFEQVIDLRGTLDAARGAPPRVGFGQRWIDHPVDLFAENVAHFPILLELDDGEDRGAFDALVLHNGTVWRWNRPVLAGPAGHETLRLENRVLPAPPTASDGAADVALFLGLVAGLRDDVDGLTARLPFAVAADNLQQAAEHGIGAELRWPDDTTGALRTIPVTALLAGGLLETAADGLARLGVPGSEAATALDIIAARVASGRTGATWQLATLRAENSRHDRTTALARTVQRYRELQLEGEPVHRWPLPTT
jgi:hypothetical protein